MYPQDIYCDINKKLKNIVIKKHDTSSNSIIIFGYDSRLKKKVTLKLFTYTPKAYSESLIYEKISILMKYNKHNVTFLGIGRCKINDMMDRLSRSVFNKDLLKESLNRIVNPINKSIFYTAYEYIEGNSLYDSLNNLNDSKLSEILFSLIHTLLEYEKNKIMHNDLHIGNILLKKTKNKDKYTYYVGNKKFTFYSKVCPIIYDFDHANILSSKNKVINPNTNKNGVLCIKYNRCSVFKEKKDFYKLLSVLAYNLDKFKHTKTLEFIKRCIGKLSYAVSNISSMDSYTKYVFNTRLEKTFTLKKALNDEYFIHLRDL